MKKLLNTTLLSLTTLSLTLVGVNPSEKTTQPASTSTTASTSQSAPRRKVRPMGRFPFPNRYGYAVNTQGDLVRLAGSMLAKNSQQPQPSPLHHD